MKDANREGRMSTQQNTPLRVELGCSRRLAWFLLLAHLMALSVVCMVQLPWWLFPGLAAAVLYSFLRSCRQHLLRSSRRSVKGIHLDSHGNWQLTLAGGEIVPVQLHSSSYIHHLLSVLNFTAGPRRSYSVIVLQDRIDSDQFRQLRAYLLTNRAC